MWWSSALGRMRWVLPAALLLGLMGGPVSGAEAYTFGTPLVQSTGPEEMKFDWSKQKCENEDIPDMPARAFRDDQNRVQMIANHYNTRRELGPDLNNLTHQCTVMFTRHNEADPSKYNDVEWIFSPYTLDGHTIYALVHNEYQGWAHGSTWCPYTWNDPMSSREKCWYNAITFATSTDSGASYSHTATPTHLLASMPDRYDRTKGMTGFFSPSNIVEKDGWYYSLLWAAEPGSVQRGICVMRTQNLADHKSWRAWDGANFDNRFINPYTEAYTSRADHTCKQVPQEQIGIMPQSLTWNTYYQRWMLVGNVIIDYQQVPGFYFSLSKDLIHWTERRLLMNAELPWSYQCGDANPVRDSALLDPASTSRNFETAGRNPYLYFKRFNYNNCIQSLDRDLMRIPIQLNGSPPTAAFKLSANPARVGQWVSFDASPSTDAGGQIVKYEWDLDDDGTFEWNAGSDPTVDYKVSAARNANLALRVTDSEGLQDVSYVRFSTFGPFMQWSGDTISLASEGDALEPDVATLPGGRALAVWRQYDNTDPGPGPTQCCSRIRAAERSSSGSFGPVETISPPGVNASEPRLAVDALGNSYATWTQQDGSNTRVQLAFRANNSTFGASRALSEAGADAFDPEIDMSSGGDAVAVWVRSFGAEHRVQAAIRLPGASFGAPQTLSYAGLDASEPKVAVEPGGNAVVTWRARVGSSDRVQSSSLLDLDVPGFPRPQAGAKLRVPLTIAFEACDAPNRQHGPGLEQPSCNPPRQASPNLTVGTRDANGAEAKSLGSVKYSVVCNPSSCSDAGDQADLQIDLSLTDVRQSADLTDYSGQVSVSPSIRITDRGSGSLAGDPATVTDLQVPAAAQCSPTASTDIGSRCTLSTYVDAITPGTVVESKRSNWEVGAMQVFDGGPDGLASTPGNSLFATQGIFVP